MTHKQQNYQKIQEKYREKLEKRKANKEEEKTDHVTILNNKKAETVIQNQNYIAICMVGHTGNNKRIAMKFKGVFDTLEECQEHIKELMEIDDTFDIIAAEMYNWLPCDPNVNNIEQVHTDEELNQMFASHKKEQKNAMKQHQTRARKDVKDAANKIAKDFRSHLDLKDAFNKASYSKDDVEQMMSEINKINKEFKDEDKDSKSNEIELLEEINTYSDSKGSIQINDLDYM